jgi:hypothetical protein
VISLCRNVIETTRTNRRARRALAWECVALQHQLAVLRRSGTRRPRFRSIDRLFWVFMSWWWPAWRDALKVIQPETVLRWRRHGITLIWKYRSRGRWRGGRPRIALETRQLIREMARTNFLWGTPRIHGELLKLGITVSQATVSRYMPPSRKGRRSQAWRTFIRNHAITIVQSEGLNARHWTRDLLSQVQSRSRVFSYHLSAFVVAPVTGRSCWAVWHTLHPLLLAVARPRVRFTRIATLIITTKSTALAYRHPPAARKAGLLTIDRIPDPPIARELKRRANRASMRSPCKRVPFTPLTRRHSTAPSTNCLYSQTAIGASD